MRQDKLIPGVVLVLIGTLFLLHNFHVLHFHWINILHLWPVFLLIGGINLIFAHNRSGWATALKILVIVFGFGLVLFGDFGYNWNWWPNRYYRYHQDDNGNYQDNNDNDDDNDTTSGPGSIRKIEGSSNFHADFPAGTQNARLNLKGGASSYALADTTNLLFEASTTEYRNKYDLNTHQEGNTAVVDFDLKGHKGVWDWGNGNKSNRAVLKLNPRPIWDVNIDAGATSLDFDLSRFKINYVKISGGAGEFKVRLGAPLTSTKVDVSSGVSDVEISVPQNAACSIDAHSGLSSNSFDGFNKTSDNHYETPGFANATNKIYITINGGLSDFKVRRY